MDHLDAIKRIIGPNAKDWSDAEFQQADDDLRDYVAIAWRIFLRLESEAREKPSTSSTVLTSEETRHTMNEQVPPKDFQNISPDS
jgi:hypothetical protein